ncbi:PucR-like helix-turn-helix protein [Herbihabitans rhizosphaerae]|uniref:PucR-like helix-turn-helix protein n=1 Tax=Herbihabitans rhizosphaerae TaxID=1872711 RepID=A0A4Q7KD96_9PSEU|nr:helix-turn-helix domain-containing protein [Herbihabitans rhizosphaerae]RZS31184.1 PucR-like helix-turn-helix protein [Herbihabitans rhizosphaerae]
MSEIVESLDTEALRAHIVGAVRRNARAMPQLTDAEYLLSALIRRVIGTPATDRARLVTIGAAWAADGYPPGQVAAVYQAALRVIVDHLRDAGAVRGTPPEVVLGTVDEVVQRCNALAAAVAEGYQNAEHHRVRANFLRRLLFDTTATTARQDAVHCGLDPDREYLAVRGRPAPGMRPEDLARAYGLIAGYGGAAGLVTVIGEDLAGVLPARPGQGADRRGTLGVGPPRPPHRLPESFRMASRALETARRHGRTGVHEFDELGLLPTVGTDGTISGALTRRYLEPLGHNDSAVEIADTLHAYLLEGKNVARTAEQLFVHPNTVRYRIARFEELAGVSLRGNPIAVFELLWVLTHRSLGRDALGSPG